MTITDHKRLVAAIPEDLVEGDDIEVSDDGAKWQKGRFGYARGPHIYARVSGMTSLCTGWAYARRPASETKPVRKSCETCIYYEGNVACRDCRSQSGELLGWTPASETKPKRLRDDPWPENGRVIFRCTDSLGQACYCRYEPKRSQDGWTVSFSENDFWEFYGSGYDSTDWQNSLERRPE